MKICQVNTGFLPASPYVTGGVEKYVHYLSSTLQELGHEVILIDIPYVRRKTNYRVIEIPIIFGEDSSLPSHILHGLFFGYSVFQKLSSLIKSEKIDIINFHSQFSAFFCVGLMHKAGIPSVFTLHNPLWSDQVALQSYIKRLMFLMEIKAEKEANLVIFLNQILANNVINAIKLDSAKTAVIPVGIDDSWFYDVKIDRQIKQKYFPNGETLILNVGRIASYKNQLAIVKTLPNLLKEVVNVKLVLVGPIGSHSYFRMLMSVIRKMNIEDNVVFAGQVPLSELRQLYHSADVFVLPSLYENMPQTALEAMAAGRPIVYSSIDPLKEHFIEKTGIAINLHDPNALARAIIYLIQDRKLRNSLGQNARNHAYSNYRWKIIGERIAAQYSYTIDKHTNKNSLKK